MNYVKEIGKMHKCAKLFQCGCGIVKKCAVIEYPKSEIGIYQAA